MSSSSGLIVDVDFLPDAPTLVSRHIPHAIQYILLRRPSHASWAIILGDFLTRPPRGENSLRSASRVLSEGREWVDASNAVSPADVLETVLTNRRATLSLGT